MVIIVNAVINAIWILYLRDFIKPSLAQDVCPSSLQPRLLKSSLKLSQSFHTPGYLAGKYRNGLDCHWIVKASNVKNKIQISIWSSTMEDRLFTDCDDYMEIKDGSTNSAPTVVRWCGNNNPLSVTSSGDSLYLHFRTDKFLGKAGVNLTFTEFELSNCPNNWLASQDRIFCYKLINFGATWTQAQNYCTYDRSNLATLANRDEYDQIFRWFSARNQYPWIGVYDANDEGTFFNIDKTPHDWPVSCDFTFNEGLCFPQFLSHETRDCLYMDFTKENALYGIDDCRNKRPFICKKKRDGSTIPYPPIYDEIRAGLVTTAGVWNLMWLWLIIVIILIILLIVLICCVVKQAKRRRAEKLRRTLDAMNENDSSDRVSSTVINNQQLNSHRGNVIRAYQDVVIERSPEPKAQKISAKSMNSLPIGLQYENSYKTNVYNKPALRQHYSNAAPIAYYVNGEPSKPIHNANQFDRNHSNHLPPVEKFDRPYVGPLDNASAISLDEFWQKIETDKIRHINVNESPPQL